MAQWTRIQVVPVDTSGMDWSRAPSCEFPDCHAESVVVIYRTSTLTGNTYSDRACEWHAAGWGSRE